MSEEIQRVAMVSMQTSPTAQAGDGDAGGLTVSILGLAAELSILGVEVDLLTRAEGRPKYTELLPGVALHELEAGPAERIPFDRSHEVSDEFGEAVARACRQLPRPPDVLHAHYWLSGIATLPVSLELGIPLAQSFHSLSAMIEAAAIPSAAEEPLSRVRSELYLATQADALIASSGAEATALIDSVGAAPDRIWVVPPGVDLGLFAPRSDAARSVTLRALGLDPDRPVALVVGRIEPHKGQELAIRAVAELRVLHGWAPQLVFAGDERDHAAGWSPWLMSLASELGIASDVHFVGTLHRDTLAELMSAAHVTLVPSWVDTFSLVALESAASGTPVIAFRTGGLADSVDDGVSGFLLGSRDPRYWATEIAIMIEDDERRAALGMSARRHAERFTWATAATGLLGVYAAIAR